MRFSRQFIALLAPIALVCAPLSACTSDAGEPTLLTPLSAPPTDSFSASPVPDAAPEPTPSAQSAPVLSEEAKQHTAAGAMAFVGHYFAVVDYAYATGDTAPLAAISHPDCLSCAGIKQIIDEAVSTSASFERGPIHVSETSAAEIKPEGWAELKVTYSTPPFRRFDANGAITLTFPEVIEQRFLMIIVPVVSGWQLRSLHEES